MLRATGIVAATFVGCVALAVGVDQHLHRKFDDLGALNYRGYRGPVVGAKEEGEHRVGVFGGSAAMGYGLPNEQSLAGHLSFARVNEDPLRLWVALDNAHPNAAAHRLIADFSQQFISPWSE